MGCWRCPRSGASACTGRARSRDTQDYHHLAKRRMGGMSPSPAPMCPYIPSHPLGRRRGSTWGWSPSPRSPMERIFTPAYYRKAEAYLRRCQRRVARRTKGSQRRRKAVVLLAKAQQHIARQRRDFHHQQALKVMTQYDTIYHEDLRVANMVQNHRLAKSISDAGWSAFLTILAFKAASAGKRVQAVNPAFTSQRCSGPECGAMVQKGFSVRWHACPACGDQPASRPQRGAQHRAAGPSDAVGGDTAFGRQREPVGCA